MIALGVLLLLASSAVEWYEKANALFAAGKYPETEAALEQALKLDPRLVPALTLKAKFAMGFNQFDTARACLLKAVEIEPDSAYVQFLLGFFFYVDNDFHRAVEPLEKARKLNPGDPRAPFYLALTREGLGQADLAVPLYELALRLEEQKGKPQPDALVAYARLMYTLGRYDKCEELVQRALRLDLKSRDAHYEMGRLLYEKRDYAGAVAQGEKALAQPGAGTTDRQIHFLLGRAYLKAGNRGRAEEHLAKFRASAPSLRR
jgi:tetratricopeptide (TPR) repeat protein